MINTIILLLGVSFGSLSAMGADMAHQADNFSKSEEVTGQRASAPTQQITRAGSQPSAVGPEANFTGRVRVDMIWPADAGITASGALVTFEPRGPLGLAHPPRRPAPDRGFGRRAHAGVGQSRAGDPSRRCGVVPARHQALAWCDSYERHDSLSGHRNRGGQECRLDGESQR
jgi:hypothetical protein